MTMYSISNTKNNPMRAFASEVGTTSNKILDYLRERGVLDIDNVPDPDYYDWFHTVLDGRHKIRRDLTEKGESHIRQMIEDDGIDYVKNAE